TRRLGRTLVLASLIAAPGAASAGDSGYDLYYREYIAPLLRGSEERVALQPGPTLYDPSARPVDEVPADRKIWQHRGSHAGQNLVLVAGDVATAPALDWSDRPSPELFRVYFDR